MQMEMGLSPMQGARDTSYALELSHNRRVTISEFKSDLRIDLREYYEVMRRLPLSKTELHCAALQHGRSRHSLE